MSAPDTETMLLDFPGWLGWQDAETRAGLDEVFKVAPDRAAEEKRIASMYAVAEGTGLDLGTVNDRWDLVRADFAAKQGGEWTPARTDDAAFYGKLAEVAKKGRDERHLLQGLDDKPDSIEAKSAAELSLLSKSRQAAYEGKSYADALSDWEALVRNKPGYDEARASDYATFAAENHLRVTQALEKARPVAEQAFAQMARARDAQKEGGAVGIGTRSGDPGSDAAPFALLRGLTPEEKELTFRLMADMAGGEKGKTRAVAFAEAFGRSFENMALGANAGEYFDFLAKREPFKAGSMVSEADPRAELTAEWAAHLALNSAAALGEGQVARRRERTLTEAEAKEWNAAVDGAREDAETAEQLRHFGQEVIDPAKAGGKFFQKFVLPAVDSAALITAFSIPGMTAPAIRTSARAYQAEEYLRLRGAGMEAGEANKLAEVTGLAQAALDKLEVATLGKFGSKFLPNTTRALEQFTLRGSTLARFGLNAAGTLAFETGIELTQDIVIPALVQDVLTSDPRFDVQWGDVWSEVAHRAPDIAMGMVLLSAAGGLAQTREQSQFVREFSENGAAMRARGYSMEQIAEIQATPLGERGGLLAEYLPAKAPEGAEREALVKEATQMARESAAAFEEKQKAETTAASDAADYGARVVRNGDGWKVLMEGGKTVSIDSAEAARRIREDLRMAGNEQEAAALVALVEDWHGKAGDKQRETTLTGDAVTAGEGGALRNGELVPFESAREMQELEREAAMDAQVSGAPAVYSVDGINRVTLTEKTADGARQIVQRLEINQSPSAILTFLHESIEADLQAALKTGAVALADAHAAVASLAGAFDPASARDAEERAFRERVQRVGLGRASETETRETLTELAVADVLGRRRDGGTLPVGSVTTALNAAALNARSAAEVQQIGKLRAFLRAVRRYFRALFGTVAALKRARKLGGAVEFDALVAKITGTTEQAEHDAAAASEAEKLADYTPPTAEEEAAGIAFSLRRERVSPQDAIDRLEEYDRENPETWPEDLREVNGNEVERPERNRETSWEWALNEDDLDALQDVYSDPSALSTDELNRLFQEAVKGFEAAQEKADARIADVGRQLSSLGWIKGENGWREPEVAFRLTSGSRLELIQKRLDSALEKDPEKRRAIQKRAADKLSKLQFEWETERFTPRGDKIDPVTERRTAKELDKEQAMRQALRREELEDAVYGKYGALLNDETLVQVWSGPVMSHLSRPSGPKGATRGRLMSESRARRTSDSPQGYDGIDGVPRYVFGGTLRVDEAAQELYEAGLIAEATPDAMWDAIRAEIATAKRYQEFLKTAKAELKQARDTAREEAYEWRRAEDEQQKKDWSPRARLVRDLRTLDAVLSALPPEVRGKVGGFVKLAQLGSDAARVKEIESRITKMAGLLEKHLQKETTEALEKLLEQAQPSREAGKQSRGKIGAEAHRYFDQIAEVLELTQEEVEQRRAAIQAGYVAATLTPEQAADLFEQEQILDTFGAWKKKTATDMDAALQAAQEVYTTGRNRWRAAEESRLEEVATLAQSIVDALGAGTYAATQTQKGTAGSKARAAGRLSLDLKSFAEVLKSLLGEKHEVTRRWARAELDARMERNDEIRDARRLWRGAVEKATGKKGIEAQRALWEMAHTQSIEAANAGEISTDTQTVPVAIIDQWAAGNADPAALGFTRAEADELLAARVAMDPTDRRQLLPLSRSTRKGAGKVKMTQAEGIFLTMLAAQEQYADALGNAGWTADALAEVEESLSKPAKLLRQWMREQYKENYAPLAAIFERMYGVGLPQIKNYAPASFYHTGAERETGPEDRGGIGAGMRAGFLRNRKQHTAAPRLENAFATFHGHTSQSAHWKGYAELVREISGVIGRPDVKRAIEAAHGVEMLKTLNDWVRNLEGNGLDTQAGILDKAVTWLASQQAYVALAFRLGTLAKQSTALLGSAYRMPARAYARGFARLLSGQLDVREIFNSPVIQRRLETGFAPEVRAAMNDVWSAKPSRRGAILEAGMQLIGLTDALFTTGSAAIAFDYHHGLALESGLTGEAARRAAMREVEEIVDRTAQPADVGARSLFEARQGAFGRLLFMFASEARQKSSLLVTAWQNTLTGKATARDYQVLALSHLIVAPMLQAITAAWRDMRDDDDDTLFDLEHWNPLDFLKAIIAGPLAGIPLVNDALSGFPDNGIFGRQLFALKAVKQIFSGPKDGEVEKTEWYVERVLRVLQGADAFTATAASVAGQTFSILDNLFDDSEETAKQQRRRERREAKKKK